MESADAHAHAPGDAESVLAFWLGELDEYGTADAIHTRRWFAKDEAFDREITERFGSLHEAAAGGRLDGWLERPRVRLAYVIVLDQFSRNMFRGTAQTFAGDARALGAALDGIARGQDRSLRLDERWFLYMPLMHSEDLATQRRSVELFAALAADAPPARREMLTGRAKFAERHRDIVARFGRFPHRNDLLGRTSTPEEIEFLKQPGSGF